MKNILTILAAMLWFAHGTLSAQSGTTLVHTDKQFYVTGEVVWYSLHLPPFFDQLDKVVRVAIVNDRGVIVDQSHLKTGNKTAVGGYYKVPFDAPTGIYRVYFHGLSRYVGQDILLAEVAIPVYNDFERVTASLDQDEQPPSELSGTLSVDIKVNELSDANDGVLKMAVMDENGAPMDADLSVAIVDATLSNGGIITVGERVEYLAAQAMLGKMVLRGKLFDKDGEALQVNVLGAYSPEVQRVVYSKSDDNGKFFVELPDFYGPRTVQFLGYSVEVESFDVEYPKPFETTPTDAEVVYTQKVLDYLELSRMRKKIYQYFTTLEHSLEIPEIPRDIQKLEPDYRYDIEEYEDFDFMRDFFGELITPLKFIEQKDSTYRARLENPKGRNIQETNLTGEPLFIVDGIATRNADFVARLDLSLVKYVDLYYDPYKLRSTFNAVGRSGVIMITTRVPDLQFPEEEFADVFASYGLQVPVEFPASFRRDGNVPAITPQLFWKGAVETDYDGTVEVKFAKSDDRSSFRVEVVAQGEDGSRGRGEAIYKPQ